MFLFGAIVGAIAAAALGLFMFAIYIWANDGGRRADRRLMFNEAFRYLRGVAIRRDRERAAGRRQARVDRHAQQYTQQ